MSTWPRIVEALKPTSVERAEAAALLREVRVAGHTARTQTAMVHLSDATIAAFFAELATNRSTHSPVTGRSSSGWMCESSFCFINVRATGLDGRFGTFIHAAKLLPAITANAIHLGPFTRYDHRCIYAVTSVHSIAGQVVHAALDAAGIAPEDQLRAFVEAAHMLGKTVGYDVEPHLSQFSVPAMMNPRIVRWMALGPDRERLADGMFLSQQLETDAQNQIANRVQDIVRCRLERESIDDLEWHPPDVAATRHAKEQAFFSLIGELIGAGLWAIPSQVWCGAGVPDFAGYNHEGNYPRFRYLDRQGVDRSEWAYHIMAPYRFYDGIPVNAPPTETPTRNNAAFDFLKNALRYWRDEFAFDFFRYDSVDHILDSVVDAAGTIPASDRPTPRDLTELIDATRSGGCPHIGNLAERMGTEATAYAAMGFDLMLGDDMMRPTDRASMQHALALGREIENINAHRTSPFSVTWAVDTHDTGNPFLCGQPLVKLLGDRPMRRRQFLARFLGTGSSRRPPYECMGTTDLSWGLFASNVTEENLHWEGHESHNAFCQFLDTVYTENLDIIRHGRITASHIEDTHAWWVIDGGDAGLLAAAVALDQGGVPQSSPAFSIQVPGVVGGVKRRYDFGGLCFTDKEFHDTRIEFGELRAWGIDLVRVKTS